MKAGWIHERDESVARRLSLLPLGGAAWLYGLGARLHRGAYARGWRRQARLGCRVVSVGSLSVGGSGKTPTAAWIASELHRRGHNVAIASRGYRRRGGDRVEVVSDGRFVRTELDRSGDEPWLLVAQVPGVPVLVGPDRGVVGLRAVSAFGAEVLVLDDGFHHHRLARDVDVVTFDGVGGLGNGHVLPRGPLREPPASLRLADAVGVVDGPLAERDEEPIRRYAASAFRFEARRSPVSLWSLGERSRTCSTPDELSGAEVGLVAGIARPQSFKRTLEGLGAHVVAERTFPDHHSYVPADLRGLGAEASLWITTEKDAIKMSPRWASGVDLRVLSIRLEVAEPLAFLEWLEGRLH